MSLAANPRLYRISVAVIGKLKRKIALEYVICLFLLLTKLDVLERNVIEVQFYNKYPLLTSRTRQILYQSCPDPVQNLSQNPKPVQNLYNTCPDPVQKSNYERQVCETEYDVNYMN